MTNEMSLYMCTLACRHVVYYKPIPQELELLYCQRCRTWRTCITVELPWSWRCTYRSCPNHSRDYGADQGRARRMAIRHLRLNPGHPVWLCRGKTPIEKIMDGQRQLPIVTELQS